MPRGTFIRFIALSLSSLVLCQTPSSAEVSTFTVSRFDDPPPNGCFTNDCSLREAIIAANTLVGADMVKLPAGTYVLSIEGPDEDASMTGDLDITEDVSIIGNDHAATIIDAAAIDRVFHLGSEATQISVSIEDLTIRNGHAVFTRGADSGSGGGLFIRAAASATLIDVRITSNAADLRGGAVYSEVDYSRGRAVKISESQIDANTSCTPNLCTGGGGIWNDGVMTLDHVTVTDNSSGFGGAGGIWNDNQLTITNSSIASNAAGSSAGILNGGTLTIADSSVTENASRTSGGGISGGGAGIVITRTTIAGNKAGQEGGGIDFSGDPGILLRIEDSTINNNFAGTQGGGIYNWFGGDVLLRNVTVSANEAGEEGYGLYLASGSATIINSTFAHNSSPEKPSSAIVNANGSLAMRNSIVAYTFAGPNCVGMIDSLGYNIDDHETCNFNSPGDLSNADPMLSGLANNGGPTLTHALQQASPAIDAAEDAVCSEADQRGRPRYDGDGDGDTRCDIGAFEFEALSIPTATPSPSSIPAVTPTATPTAVAGDANCDGRVTSLDATLILHRVARLIPSLPCSVRADANRDGKVGAVDAALVLQIAAGLLPKP